MCNVSTSLARQRQFLPLLCALPNQETSIYQLLSQLEQRASIMLRHLNKAGNGSVPKATPPKPSESETSSSFNLFPKCFSRCRSSPSTLSSPSSSESEMAEEKLARYQTDKIITLYMNNIDYSGTFISWKLVSYILCQRDFENASHCFFMHVNFFISNLHLSQNFSSDSLSLWHQGLTVDIVICVIHEALTSISHFIFLNCSELIWLYSFIFREFAVLFNLVKGMCKKFSHNTVIVTL